MELALLKAAWDAGTQDDLQIDIPLRTGVQITRVFRDSRTKRPVSGLAVRIRPAVTRPPIEEALNIPPWVAQLTRLPLQDAYLVGVGEVAVNTLLAMLWQRRIFAAKSQPMRTDVFGFVFFLEEPTKCLTGDRGSMSRPA